LPEILPPKRRRLRNPPNVAVQIEENEVLSRLSQEFPKHNWLENKIKQFDHNQEEGQKMAPTTHESVDHATDYSNAKDSSVPQAADFSKSKDSVRKVSGLTETDDLVEQGADSGNVNIHTREAANLSKLENAGLSKNKDSMQHAADFSKTTDSVQQAADFSKTTDSVQHVADFSKTTEFMQHVANLSKTDELVQCIIVDADGLPHEKTCHMDALDNRSEEQRHHDSRTEGEKCATMTETTHGPSDVPKKQDKPDSQNHNGNLTMAPKLGFRMAR
jgi:hypothetical protein